jgi:hypothetical protein
MKQFFYTRREPVAPKEEGQGITFEDYTDSFDLDQVKRTIEYEKGKIAVVLSDGHEQADTVPVRNNQGKVTGEKSVRVYVQTEITLDEYDTKRFWEVSGRYQ